MSQLASTVGRSLTQLCRQTGGNVTVLFAVAIVPVLLAAGVAVDYVRASSAQTKLQAAADGAALAIATSGAATNSERKQAGNQYFRNNFRNTDLESVRPQYDIVGSTITVSVEYDYPTTFMALAGITSMRIGSFAEVQSGNDRNAEVVMVLDYSGSMKQNNKYVRMRDAAIRMVDELAGHQNSNQLKVGLVPFSAMVRASMPAEHVTQASDTAIWTGCTQDREYPLNLGVSTPDGSARSKWGYIDPIGENSNPKDCPAYGAKNLDILPLSADLNAAKARLAIMQPLGNTNIPLGFEFGWNLLDPDAPYTEGAPYSDTKTKKFIVLLTDGVQTSRHWGEDGNRSVDNGNDNLVTLCANAAARGVTIFAIAYDITADVVTSLLKECAGANYFEASTSGTEIDAVFNAITLRIKKSTLRLTR